MTRNSSLESQLTEVLGLTRRPVAVSTSPQPGIPKFSGSVPAGCSFWRLAAEGRSFYTEAGDHYNCAIGCYTHNIPLPPEREAELGATIAFMTSIGYIRPEDIPADFLAGLSASPATSEAASFLGVGDYREAKQQFEVAYIKAKLREHGGNITRTAAAIGLHRQSLQEKLRELGIQAERD